MRYRGFSSIKQRSIFDMNSIRTNNNQRSLTYAWEFLYIVKVTKPLRLIGQISWRNKVSEDYIWTQIRVFSSSSIPPWIPYFSMQLLPYAFVHVSDNWKNLRKPFDKICKQRVELPCECAHAFARVRSPRRFACKMYKRTAAHPYEFARAASSATDAGNTCYKIDIHYRLTRESSKTYRDWS